MLKEHVQEILASVLRELHLELPAPPPLDVPRDPRHGDLSTNVALVLAKQCGMAPAQLAQRILASLQARTDLQADVSLAGPGFINFRLHATNLSAGLLELLRAGVDYGRSTARNAVPMQLEFVSANPTGPLNVVSARAAAYGSTLAAMLRFAGHPVQCEFYVNDAGRQVELLGVSLRARWAEAHGAKVDFPEDGYHGDYVRRLAASVPADQAEAWMALPEPESSRAFGEFAVERMLASQKADLQKFGVQFDRWFRESELHASGAVEATRRLLVERGHTYEQDGALFFRSTTWNDDKDRVLLRSDGRPTYFLADAAYHRDKHERGFRHVLDVWGPDHHGHVVRMQALAGALGYETDWLEVIIVQWVRLLEAGETVVMSKRAGQIVTLADLVEEVGADVAKYFFLMRQQSSHLDFDLDLARQKSEDNPVYYVKYAHARICSVIRKAAEAGIRLRVDEPLFGGELQLDAEGAPRPETAPVQLLQTPEEQTLVKLLLEYGDLVRRAAMAREPHRLTHYGEDLARAFHKFYHEHRVLQENRDLAVARLALCHATRRVLASTLALMSIAAPETM